MSEISTEIMVPGVGSIVSLDDPSSCAHALDDLRDLEHQLRLVKQELTRALVHHSQQAGSKTLHLEGATATIKGGAETVYDAEEIMAGLLDAGMTAERVSEIVVETVARKVAATEAKRAAAANPAYAQVIENFTTTVEKPFSVSISLSKQR